MDGRSTELVKLGLLRGALRLERQLDAIVRRVLASRADYNELLQFSRVSVRVHPFFASILNAPGGKLLREHFARVASERRELIQEQKES